MKVFKDTAGREWTIHLTIGSAMQVKDTLGIDLMKPEEGDPPLLARLGTDEFILAEIILCLISGQIEAKDISPQEMRMAFDGQTILAAHEALYEELIVFFRSRGRMDRVQAVTKQMEIVSKAIATAARETKALDADELVAQKMSGIISGTMQGP